MSPARAVATVAGIGYLRPAPGTWGSLAALPLAWALHLLAGPLGLAAGLVAAFAGGWWAVARAAEAEGLADPDRPEFVIDELAGMFAALLPVSLGAWVRGVEVTALWPGWMAAFLLFRLFDIWKPGPAGQADRSGTPLGVMLDDLWAGLFAAAGVMVLAAAAHGVMGWG